MTKKIFDSKRTRNSSKRLAFAMTGFLALGLTLSVIPLASAVPPPADWQQIMDGIADIQDALESQSNHVRRGSVVLEGDDSFRLLAQELILPSDLDEDKVYSGHITVVYSLSTVDEVILYCTIGEEGEGGQALAHFPLAILDDSNISAEIQFDCHGLWLWVDDTDGVDSVIRYAMEYRVTEEAEELGTTIY